jgi:hypothetical protein
MHGFITTRHVLLHPVSIIVPFGVHIYLHCLVRIAFGRGRATFLECIRMKRGTGR